MPSASESMRPIIEPPVPVADEVVDVDREEGGRMRTRIWRLDSSAISSTFCPHIRNSKCVWVIGGRSFAMEVSWDHRRTRQQSCENIPGKNIRFSFPSATNRTNPSCESACRLVGAAIRSLTGSIAGTMYLLFCQLVEGVHVCEHSDHK